MTLEKVYEILETEKFTKYFIKKCSAATKIELIMLRETFSRYFNIPEDLIYSTLIKLNFFKNYLSHKPELDIDKIKLDIINNEPLLSIAVKYLISIDAVEEIKLKLKNENIIFLDSKIYTNEELISILKYNTLAIQNVKLFNSLKETHPICSKNFICSGKVLNDNIEIILNARRSTDSLKMAKELNTDIVQLSTLGEKICNKDLLRSRYALDKNIFGVKLTKLPINDNVSYYRVFIKRSEYEEILLNKKYYEKSKILKDTIPKRHSFVITNYYRIIYNKDVNLRNLYLKKETIKNYLNIYNNFKNNYKLYIDILYDFILNSKSKKFSIKELMSAINNAMKLSEEDFNNTYRRKGDMVNKKIILNLLDEHKKISSKYTEQ